MTYTKPHLAYDAQVELMRQRGLEVGEVAAAVRALKRIGYYRLSAYTYPMRSGGSDAFQPGATLREAVAMHDFDHRLRKVLLPALQTIEIALRTRVAYALGKHGPLAHLSAEGLDRAKCNETPGGPDHTGTKYEVWRNEYDRLQSKAMSEEYVQHFVLNYGGEVPVWAATEFMTMGSLIALFRLMKDKDANRIARDLGVKDQKVLFGWLKALNVLRNHCAHNARVWNRKTIYPPTKVNVHMVEDDLHHLAGADSSRLYFLVAITAYLLRRIDPDSRLVSDVISTMNKLPPTELMSPIASMAFPTQWRDLALWQP